MGLQSIVKAENIGDGTTLVERAMGIAALYCSSFYSLNHTGSRRLLGKQCYKAEKISNDVKPGEPQARDKITQAHFAQNCPARKREYDSHEGWEVATWKGLRIRRKRDTQLKVRAREEIRAAAASTAASVHSCRNTGCT